MVKHKPTAEQRKQVETMSGLGLPHEQIASLIGLLDDKTLRLHYRKELDEGKGKANGSIAKRLFQKAAIEGDTTALIWWTKTQMRWSDNQNITLQNPDGTALFKGVQVTFVDSKA